MYTCARIIFSTHIHMHARTYTTYDCWAVKLLYNVMHAHISVDCRMHWTLSILHLYTVFCTHYNSYRSQIASYFICFSWVRAHVCAYAVRLIFSFCTRIIESLIFWKSYYSLKYRSRAVCARCDYYHYRRNEVDSMVLALFAISITLQMAGQICFRSAIQDLWFFPKNLEEISISILNPICHKTPVSIEVEIWS